MSFKLGIDLSSSYLGIDYYLDYIVGIYKYAGRKFKPINLEYTKSLCNQCKTVSLQYFFFYDYILIAECAAHIWNSVQMSFLPQR